MAKDWTTQQKQALEADGTLTVLSAAAGSGKTTVLVEKALRILLDEQNKTPADRLLIVTFSNASAKEFKNKIEKGINEAIRNNPGNSYIKSQKIALQKADISTIHSFCIKLARENFEALDIAPDFAICDEAKSLLIHQKAIDAAMEYGYTLPDFANFVTLFGKSSQDKQVREFLQYMYYYFSALPFPQQKAQQLCKLAQSENFRESEIYKYLWKSIGEQVDYAVYLVNRMYQLADTGGVQGYENGMALVAKSVALMAEAYKKGDAMAVKAIAADKLPSLGRVKSKSDFSVAIGNVNKELKDVMADIAEDADYLDGERYRTQQQQTQKYISALTDVFVFYSQKLMEIKKQEKAFEFSDFEHFAVELLVDKNGGRTKLAQSLSEKYVKIMEDEFQDTSFVQDMIFKTIAKDDEANLFVVGDVKQSIYGFRKASPQILLEKRSRELIDKRLGRTVVLPNNFRSEVAVIKAVNYLFENIMSRELGGVDYKYGEQLLPAPKRKDTGKVGAEIIITAENEPQLVAHKIHDMVAEGYIIGDGEDKRPVKYDDFCILLRNKKRFEQFSEALKQLGINSFVKDEKPLLEKPEVQSVISLLKVINNPMQEVYLTAGMFGEIFGFTLDEILGLKLKDKKENLYRLLVHSEDEKAQNFLAMLKEFSFAAKIYSPDKLTDYIINATGYYTRLSFSDKGGEKRENLRRFILFAKNYVSGYQSSLGDFLRYIDLCIESGKAQGESFRQPADTVAIMTMHTSKGLEFPVCFISGLGTAFNKMDRANRLMIDPVLGMATYANEKFGYNRSTAGIHAIKKKVLAANADDEMRLLYVAATRAKNKMFFTAQYTNMFTKNTLQKLYERTGEEISGYALKKANTPMDWILAGYLHHPALADGFFVNKDTEDGTYLSFAYEDADICEKNTAEEKAENCKVAAFDIQKAQENFAYVYPNLAKTKLPIKVSVGEIAKAPPPVVLKKPDFAVSRGASAAQKGTQMHLFAQHSDILLARTNLANEIERLADAGVVDRKLLDMRQIETFVNSRVAEIMLGAENIYKEKEFLVPYGADSALNDKNYTGENLLVQGVIDCLVINGDKAVVIDYKTDRVESMHTLYERYSKQLELYRYAAQYLYDVTSVECIIYSFHLGEHISF
ncbi:MAG: UvrD-helicase domain-containing protein [Oscillospiraceae bacterium]|nr:UvrD-helicase domain-containing protein [Oscillospiraceae bacterium]